LLLTSAVCRKRIGRTHWSEGQFASAADSHLI
jgi:hypothetical protein